MESDEALDFIKKLAIDNKITIRGWGGSDTEGLIKVANYNQIGIGPLYLILHTLYYDYKIIDLNYMEMNMLNINFIVKDNFFLVILMRFIG